MKTIALKMDKFVIILIALVNIIAAAKELPQGFELCHKSDPKAGTCLSKAIQSSLAILKDGVSALNIPPIEPMKIASVVVDQAGATSAINLRSSFTNAEIHGLSRSVVIRTATKFKKFALRSDTYTDRLDFIGQYTMKGQILVLPIVGEGFANFSMQELSTRHELHGDYYTGKDNNTYVNITSYKIKFTPKHVTFRFDNLFNGDKLLGETMNNFMNNNWEPVFNGLIPGYEEQFGEKFKSVANILFSQIPFDFIFLN